MTYGIVFLLGLLTGLALLCFLRGADTRGTDEVKTPGLESILSDKGALYTMPEPQKTFVTQDQAAQWERLYQKQGHL